VTFSAWGSLRLTTSRPALFRQVFRGFNKEMLMRLFPAAGGVVAVMALAASLSIVPVAAAMAKAPAPGATATLHKCHKVGRSIRCWTSGPKPRWWRDGWR
jgi:hypothetical protein